MLLNCGRFRNLTVMADVKSYNETRERSPLRLAVLFCSNKLVELSWNLFGFLSCFNDSCCRPGFKLHFESKLTVFGSNFCWFASTVLEVACEVNWAAANKLNWYDKLITGKIRNCRWPRARATMRCRHRHRRCQRRLRPLVVTPNYASRGRRRWTPLCSSSFLKTRLKTCQHAFERATLKTSPPPAPLPSNRLKLMINSKSPASPKVFISSLLHSSFNPQIKR